MRQFKFAIAPCFALGLLTLAPVAHGAPEAAAGAGTLEEVVVTAQKRTETVQSVPLSISVLPSEQLIRQGVSNVSDLASVSASVEFAGFTANGPGSGAFVRGIGTETVGGSTATGSVAVVLDGVTLGNTAVSSIFDVNHVEVLKGPQGTLFGSSVSAGVINIVTNAPNLTTTSLDTMLEYSSPTLGSEYQHTVLRATANLPISDTAGLRIAMHSDDSDGVFHNVYNKTDSSEPNTGARVRFLWEPSDAVTVNLIYDYGKSRHDNYPSLTYRSAPTDPPYAALSSAIAACGMTPGPNNFDFCSQFPNTFSQLDRGGSLQVDWRLANGLTVTSITADRTRVNSTQADIEDLPLDITRTYLAFGSQCQFFNCVPIYGILPGSGNGPQTQNRRQLSEELRLASATGGRVEWLAGVYYQDYKLDDIEPGQIIANFGGGEFTAPTDWWAKVKTSELAGFGNLKYSLTDTLRLLVGARYTRETVDETQFDPPDGVTSVLSRSTDEDQFTWRLGLQADFGAHTMGYATVSTGFKAQQIADKLIGADGQLGREIAPEKPINYELGIKTSALDNRLAVDAAIFFERVKDFQGQACAPNTQGTITCVADNVPSVDSKGVELDIFGRPFAGFTANLSAIYNDAKYPNGYNGSDGVSLAGKQIDYSSKFKATLSAEETVAMTGSYSLVIGADVTYRSEQRLYPGAESWFVAPATTTYNARLGVSSDKDWSIFLFGRNLSNEPFPRQIFPTPFQSGPPGQPGGLWQNVDASARRLVGLQLQAKF